MVQITDVLLLHAQDIFCVVNNRLNSMTLILLRANMIIKIPDIRRQFETCEGGVASFLAHAVTVIKQNVRFQERMHLKKFRLDQV